MKSSEILKQLDQVATVKDLTSVFESIASLRIAHIKDRVATSENYFHELWSIYTQLRVDTSDVINRPPSRHHTKPNCYLVLTSEGGLSGDIDERIIREVLKSYDATTTDLIVVGAHGALLLAQKGIKPHHYFRLPTDDQLLDVGPVTTELLKYQSPTAFYQAYHSLAVQDVGRIDLLAHVQTLGKKSKETETISIHDYLFEPGITEVVAYLESVMLGIAVNQLILESRLAQYASRFIAMSAASQAATKLTTKIGRDYRQTRRAEADERAKEIVSAMAVTQ